MGALSPEGQALQAARTALRDAMKVAVAAAVRDARRGVPEMEAARRHGITRPTLRKALGKDQT